MMDIKTEQIITNVHKVGIYLSVDEISTICESLYVTNKDDSLYGDLTKIMKDAIDAIKSIDQETVIRKKPAFEKVVTEEDILEQADKEEA